MTKHVAIYVRVSSKAQDQRSQLRELKRWQQGCDGPFEWYEDVASGRTMKRTGWLKLQAAMDNNCVSKIVCWRLDRLGRTAAGLTKLFEELHNRRIGLVSVRDGLDLETPAGRLMANVLASVAAYENEVRTERIIAGQAAARAQGKRWGGSEKGRRIKVRPEQVEVIRRLKQDGKPVAAIARAVGLSRPSVYSVLANGS